MVASETRWSGRVLLRPGVGVFAGEAGDNKAHLHWAHQVSIGLDGDVAVAVAGNLLRGLAVFVPAGEAHQLMQGRVIAIYVDPTSAWAKPLAASSGTDGTASILAGNWIGDLRRHFLMSECLASCVDQIADQFKDSFGASTDARLALVLNALQNGVRDPSIRVDRAVLANLAGVSGSRFSHWFSGQTGMPFRSYRKWLRLIHGLELALAGIGLTDVAHQSGFADHAYFTRTFVALFCIAPSKFLVDIQLQAGDE